MKTLLNNLALEFRMKIPFLLAGFLSFLFSVYLYFVLEEESAGIFVGLWVPSIHSLGTLILTSTETENKVTDREKVLS